MESYSHIVPLGGRCATTHHIRRFFNHGEGYPFDWWITPLAGLLKVLERPDVSWLYDPALLSVTDGDKSVMHTPTGILFHHEFPRVAGDGTPIRADFLEHLDTPRGRTAKLLTKLKALDVSGNRILFIREDGKRAELLPVLAAQFSHADWTLEVIPNVHPGPDFKPARPGLQWQGNPATWDIALAKLDARLDNPSLKPFSDHSAMIEKVVNPAV